MRIDPLAHVKNSLSSFISSLGAELLFIARNGRAAAGPAPLVSGLQGLSI